MAELTCGNCGRPFPVGGGCENCEPQRKTTEPDLEEILRASQGIPGDFSGVASTMAETHAMWRRAWRDTGEFDDAESFELVRIIVAASAGGLRALD